ncbi:hypothetical protein GGS20DRAFT_531607 [Poronia punctata]|nr:hypothetical protein GGS20DRAFT_531607 [Poronia punctata]
MGGLVAYESSDEEEEEVKPQPQSKSLRKNEAPTADANSTPDTPVKAADNLPESGSNATDEAPDVYGPQMGPTTSGPELPPLEDPDPETMSVPGSPYSANRALLRNLTLPPVPDMDIPPSPPGSPSAATGKKFENFLELKKKGVHFNARLADNPTMRNPALVDKLLAFADLDHRDQYRNTLAADLWDPDAFPRHAYKEQLRQSQSDISQARARAPGAPVNFVVSETTPAVAQEGRAAQVPSTGRRKTRFDT